MISRGTSDAPPAAAVAKTAAELAVEKSMQAHRARLAQRVASDQDHVGSCEEELRFAREQLEKFSGELQAFDALMVRIGIPLETPAEEQGGSQ